jgi:hypothetical protein
MLNIGAAKKRAFRYITILGCSENASEAQKEADHYSFGFWDWGEKGAS